MKKLLLLLVVVNFLGCRTAYLPDTKDVKEFFAQMDNGILSEKKFLLINKITGDEGEHKHFKEYYARQDTILTELEIKSIVKAMAGSHKGIWTNKYFDSAKIVSKEYIDSVTKQNQNWTPPAHYTFSLPWFSNDNKFAVLSFEHYCGRLCGEWSVGLYKKVNGRWFFVKFYDVIFS